MIVGDFTYGHENIHIESPNMANLVIGKYCSIAQHITIFCGGSHRTDWVTTYPFGHIHKNSFPHYSPGHPKTNGDVIIGNDVWIGYKSTIMSGITIGDGAVIAANSHVVKNVQPYSIVGGNPAKHIKFRFEQSVIDKLLEMRWWNWHPSHIHKNLSLLCSDNFDQLYEYYITTIKK